MPTVQIQFRPTVVKNIDGSLLDVDHCEFFDGFFDQQKNYRRRPGLLLGADFASGGYSPPIDGLYYWPGVEPPTCIMVAGKWVTRMNVYPSGISPFGPNDISTIVTLGTEYFPGVRPTFANDGTYVYFANGGRICRADRDGTLSVLSHADAPVHASHIAWLDNMLLANDTTTGRIKYSIVGDALSWYAEDLFSTASNPDKCVAFKIVNRQIYLFGNESLEIWEHDGETPFSRVPGGALEVGCIAPYSVITEDQQLMWLDDKRRFVQLNGTNLEHVSTSYDSEIAAFERVDDCIGDVISIDGFTFYVFTFPSANRTIVHCRSLGSWHEWGFWDAAAGEYQRILPSSFAYIPGPGKLLAGSRRSAKVYLMSRDHRDDDEADIRFMMRTPHLDYGTLRSKRSRRLYLRARRGEGGSSNPVLMFRYRNNNSQTWSNYKHLSLGNSGATEHVLKVGPTGIYRTRQYEIVATDGVPIEFGKLEEDVQVLG